MAGNTRNNDDDEPEVIEVIERVLDNQTFALALAGGAIVGAIILYGFLEWQKGQLNARNSREVTDRPIPTGDAGMVPEFVAPAPPEPEWAR